MLRNFIKNISYSLMANVFSIIISILTMMILPKFISIEEYGYYQLYIFYLSYSCLLTLGFNDGIYIELGGKKYESLNKNRIFSKFWLFFIIQSILNTFFCLFFPIKGENITFFKIIFLSYILANMKDLLIVLLQSTKKIKEASKIIILERLFFFSMIICLFFFNKDNYKNLIIIDIMTKTFSLIIAIYVCKDITLNGKFSFLFMDIFQNMKCGIKILFSHIITISSLGIIRFFIEKKFGIINFGKISLILSILNLILIFANAISITLFPYIKSTEHKLDKIYFFTKEVLEIVIIFSSIFYFPLTIILGYWLPKYSEALKYLIILLPISFYEIKYNVLNKVYLKALYKEAIMLKISVYTFLISVFIVFFFNKLEVIIYLIPITYMFKCILSEYTISKILKKSISKDIVINVIFLYVIFIINLFLKKDIKFNYFLVIIVLSYFYYKKEMIKKIIFFVKLINKK